MRGSLVYVMGPSGAGKDSLIDLAKAEFAGERRIEFARRYITREASRGGEDFQSVSPAAFELLEAAGFFFFSWRSHGLAYGCDRGIESRLDEGRLVVVNGSRAYLPRARERVPGLRPLMITARPEVLAARLKSRGRETAAEQSERLGQPDYEFGRKVLTIDNSGPLEAAAGPFLAFLRAELERLNQPE